MDRDRKGGEEVWGVAGATNCVFERLVETVWVRGSPCCQQDITARKRPTSYGNSNSVQVFSAYTFAAKRAPDWPGGQAGPQEGRFEWECGKSKSFRSGFILHNLLTHTPRTHFLFLSLSLCGSAC